MTCAGLYVHVPFCAKKCDYCDFPSFPAIEVSVIDQYLNAIAAELKSKTDTFPENLKHIATLYIGGGTPSVLSSNQLECLGEMLCRHVNTDYLNEFSIESNPGTVNKEKLLSMKRIGCDRISIGCQSFDDADLKTLGRIHNASQIIGAFALARAAGFRNISIDLIYGIPGQSTASFLETLSRAVALGPEHISAYGLQIEENTPFWDIYGDRDCTDNDIQYEMYKYTIEFLKSHGYVQYEISNFARPGFECKHNINYWLNGEYLGVGLSAASHLNGKRFVNGRNLEAYINDPEGSYIEESRAISDEMNETIFMNLRLLKGIDIKGFKDRFGIDLGELYEDEIKELTGLGLLVETSDNLRLTGKGLFLGNAVFAKFV